MVLIACVVVIVISQPPPVSLRVYVLLGKKAMMKIMDGTDEIA